MSAVGALRASRRLLRSLAALLLRRLQGSRRYRGLAGALAGGCTVRPATGGEPSRLARTRPGTGHPQSGPHADVVTYVAERRGRVVGWEHLVIGDAASRFPGPWLVGLYVVGRCRGRGIGGRLVRQALESCRSRGFDCLSLQVSAADGVAVALYRRCGFVEVDDAAWVARMDDQYRRHGLRRVVMHAHVG